jgi:FAD synthetase
MVLDEIERILNEEEESNPLNQYLKRSIQVIQDSVRLYGPEAIAISFNGGKDATVSLHLLRYVLSKQNLLHTLSHQLPVIYFDDSREFPEMVNFLNKTREEFGLAYTVFNCSFKEGVRDLVETRGIKAIIMGVRYGDPSSETAEHWTPTTASWPAVMRIYPILHWKHSHGLNSSPPLFFVSVSHALPPAPSSSVDLPPVVSDPVLLAL